MKKKMISRIIPRKVNNSWKDFMTGEVINELKHIEKEIGHFFYPDSRNVLKFLDSDLDNIKYIIVGTDPYPSNYYNKNDKCSYPVATGRSFEIAGVDSFTQKFKQSSLRNIVKAIYYNKTGLKKSIIDIREEIENGKFEILPPKLLFDNLEEQGVLFLNATLTVTPNSPESHREIWANFRKMLIKYILEKNKNVKWLLWGKSAQELILPFIDEKNAYLSCHPRIADFVDQNCFQYAKDINWTGK